MMRKVDAMVAMVNARSDQVMTVLRKNGTTRQFTLKIVTDNGDRAFCAVTEPAREKGTQMLRLGNLVWRYSPDAKKWMRISGRERFLGSDLLERDILGLHPGADNVKNVVQDMNDTYVLELEGEDLELGATSKIWVSKGDFYPIRQEYFSGKGRLLKTVFYRDYTEVDGAKRPATIEIQSTSCPERKTTLKLLSYRKSVAGKASVFQRSAFGRPVEMGGPFR
jgi:outer membrane lipoprotein-sorting protein